MTRALAGGEMLLTVSPSTLSNGIGVVVVVCICAGGFFEMGRANLAIESVVVVVLAPIVDVSE